MTKPISHRITEAQADQAITKLLQSSISAQRKFLGALGAAFAEDSLSRIEHQRPHAAHSGTIDLVMHLASGWRLLVENKIDAGWSVTRNGERQPMRYRSSVETWQALGHKVASVLVAPQSYLGASRHASEFGFAVAYESLLDQADSPEISLLREAILQAERPYEAVPNASTGNFFADYAALIAEEYPSLVLKQNPNGADIRPTESRTFYFEAKRMLLPHQGMPFPRISVQARDSGAPSASAKLMIADWGVLANKAPSPASLQAIGAHLRPAGRSLGLVINTPGLDTQRPFEGQLNAVRHGLDAIACLSTWWNNHGGDMLVWYNQVKRS